VLPCNFLTALVWWCRLELELALAPSSISLALLGRKKFPRWPSVPTKATLGRVSCNCRFRSCGNDRAEKSKTAVQQIIWLAAF